MHNVYRFSLRGKYSASRRSTRDLKSDLATKGKKKFNNSKRLAVNITDPDNFFYPDTDPGR
jgi:hypothetical protein